MSTYGFETDDVFDRKRYAQFLISVIQNSNSFQRADENRSYTICLDSGYGTGKSVFLQKLKNMIEFDFDKNGIGVVSYNAWENDFYEDAFTPFLYFLLNDPWLDDARKADDAKGTATMAKDTLFRVGKSIAKTFVKNKLGEDAAEILQSAFDGTEKKVNGPWGDTLSDYKKFRDNISEFNIALESCLVAWNLNKLVIIIDELDRCKPDFAIRTLEITKHLMNVKNVVFLFAIDKSQLSKAVEKVYGYGMDADGYLCKFFDYLSVMPKPSVADYISNKVDIMLDSYSDLYADERTLKIRIKETMIDMCNMCLLTIRDIDTLLVSYSIVLNAFLNKYRDIEAFVLYLVCLMIKYKYPALYQKIVSKQYNDESLKNSPFGHNQQLKRFLTNAGKKIADSDTDYSLYNYGNRDVGVYRGMTINDNVIIYRQYINNRWEKSVDHISSSVASIDGLFFIEDQHEWNTLAGTTYGEYIHKKLEMFNFVQPKDQ